MMEVYVNTIRFDDFLELIDEGLTGCFYSQNFIDFCHVVTGGFGAIQKWVSQTFLKAASIGFEDDVLILFFFIIRKSYMHIFRNAEHELFVGFDTFYSPYAAHRCIFDFKLFL